MCCPAEVTVPGSNNNAIILQIIQQMDMWEDSKSPEGFFIIKNHIIFREILLPSLQESQKGQFNLFWQGNTDQEPIQKQKNVHQESLDIFLHHRGDMKDEIMKETRTWGS